MLQRITLHLARSSEFPEGSAERGYELVAPVDSSGHLDLKEWRKLRTQCHVRRCWRDEGERRGMLLHHAGGARIGRFLEPWLARQCAARARRSDIV